MGLPNYRMTPGKVRPVSAFFNVVAQHFGWDLVPHEEVRGVAGFPGSFSCYNG